MSDRIVVSFRSADDNRAPRDYLRGARVLSEQAAAMGGRLIAWGSTIFSFEFEADALVDAVELALAQQLPGLSRAQIARTSLTRHGVAVIVATMSPSRNLRDRLRNEIPRFMEVYVKHRGPVGTHQYEEPLRPDVEIAPATEISTMAAERIVQALESRHYIPRAAEVTDDDEEQQIIKRLKDFGYM
jgi:hypothetical protein